MREASRWVGRAKQSTSSGRDRSCVSNAERSWRVTSKVIAEVLQVGRKGTLILTVRGLRLSRPCCGCRYCAW